MALETALKSLDCSDISRFLLGTVAAEASKPTPNPEIPFTPKFLQINSPPVFLDFFIFTGIRCGVDIAQKTKQEWPDSGFNAGKCFFFFLRN